jgi:hypothetical protein
MKHNIIPPDPKNWTPHTVMFKRFSESNLLEYIEVHKILLKERKDDEYQVKRLSNLIYLAQLELEERKKNPLS